MRDFSTIFVDLDGVLADFDTGYQVAFGTTPDKKVDNVDWKLVERRPGFYANLPPMKDWHILWEGLSRYPNRKVILTGVPKIPSAAHEKVEWVHRHCGKDQPVITCWSRHKSLYMHNSGDILIDDWEKYKELWIGRGGRWITHVNAENSLAELERMLG